ncbi:MAG: hypothetical protein KF858_03910 [Candidatus Sumerlaeia bacterium]|nr:hypothetical protein [Candidatus Sumerlaeia bacterium]
MMAFPIRRVPILLCLILACRAVPGVDLAEIAASQEAYLKLISSHSYTVDVLVENFDGETVTSTYTNTSDIHFLDGRFIAETARLFESSKGGTREERVTVVLNEEAFYSHYDGSTSIDEYPLPPEGEPKPFTAVPVPESYPIRIITRWPGTVMALYKGYAPLVSSFSFGDIDSHTWVRNRHRALSGQVQDYRGYSPSLADIAWKLDEVSPSEYHFTIGVVGPNGDKETIATVQIVLVSGYWLVSYFKQQHAQGLRYEAWVDYESTPIPFPATVRFEMSTGDRLERRKSYRVSNFTSPQALPAESFGLRHFAERFSDRDLLIERKDDDKTIGQVSVLRDGSVTPLSRFQGALNMPESDPVSDEDEVLNVPH